MKLQVAIDRVSLQEASRLAQQLDGQVDTIEIGTSLVKDYGLIQLRPLLDSLQKSEVLVDLKTIDEGAYEFRQGFQAGADQLTVMASADDGTLKTVADVTAELKRTLFIDLLAVDNERIAAIADYSDAIYGLHHAVDAASGFDAAATVAQFHADFPQIARIAVAGGIDLETAQTLAQQGIAETIIVGGKIVGQPDPLATTHTFMEAIHA